jgi:hypothetical protein
MRASTSRRSSLSAGASPGHEIPVTLPGLEQEHCHLTEVEVNEVLGLVRDIRAEVAPDNAVPPVQMSWANATYIVCLGENVTEQLRY